MNDEQIKIQQIAGDITLVLKNGSQEEKESLLGTIEKLCGIDERLRLKNWINDGMPDA